MAIYHASVKVFSRARGHSATAAAAYRAGIRIPDERTGLVHNYCKRGGVLSYEMVLPPGAPTWARDPTRLWNRVEAAETRKNGAVARELEVALPAELTTLQRYRLSRDLARLQVDHYGVAAMFAIHAPDRNCDDRAHHVHILMSTRTMKHDGFGKKVRVLDDRKSGPIAVRRIREQVEQVINRHLERAERPERVDHRSLLAQARSVAQPSNPADVPKLARPKLVVVKSAAHAGDASRCEWDFALRPHTLFRTGRQVDWLKETKNLPRVRLRQPIDHSGFTGDVSINLRAHGPGAFQANARATLVQKEMRAARDLVRTYLEGLRASAKAAAEIAELYMRVHRLSVINSLHLVKHLQRHPHHAAVLENALHMRTHFASVLLADAERRHAAVRADMGRGKFEDEVEELDVPKLKPSWLLSPRQWAHRRRAERAMKDALKQCKRLHRPSTPVIEEALSWYAEAEAERRALIPFPEDELDDALEDVAVIDEGQVPPPPSEPALELVPPPLLPKPRPR